MSTAQPTGKAVLPIAEPVSIAGLERQLVKLKRHQILPDPDQPRKDFDQKSLIELADSWRNLGQQVPIIVWPHPHRGSRSG
jgi:ParB-like nuclease domain